MKKEKIKNQRDLASELARRCTNSDGFKGDINIAQASHILKNLKEIVQSDSYTGRTFKTSKRLLNEIEELRDSQLKWAKIAGKAESELKKYENMPFWQRVKFVFCKRQVKALPNKG